ncbi:MAG: hypothetical protein AB1750_08460 [Chloroflexota bacterium]
MRRFLLPALLLLTLALAACSATPASPPSDPAPASASPASSASNPTPASTPPSASEPSPVPTESLAQEPDLATRVDEQGAIIFEVTPLRLDASLETIEFEVTMNTHSIDLSMDLAAAATLATDTGVTVQAALWDAPSGGHHVSGTLVFPATVDGKSILDGATKLTLTIVNVDAPARVFEWELK